MTDAQTAYSSETDDVLGWLALRRPQTRLSPFAVLHEAAMRLFHLMAPARVVAEQKASNAEASAQHELMRRFRQTILPHLDAAYNFARFLSRDGDAAQDIVQEAFLRAYRSFGGYRGGDPRSWLFAIVRNCCHAWRQQDRRKARFERQLSDGGGADADDIGENEIASEEDTPETAMIRRSEQQRVRDVINGLPEAMREVLVLRELEDLSYRQIAEVIDAPVGTVMSRLARARREFGEAWDECDKAGVVR